MHPSHRPSLNEHLYDVAKVSDDLRHLILHIAMAAKYVHAAIRTTEAGLAGSKNQFGEDQLKLDVLSDEIISRHLHESHLVAEYASEEQSQIITLETNAPFTVAYDPLDGSSLVDANFAIGSIFGIYPGTSLIGRKPSEQVAALYVLYGPRTLLVYSTGASVHLFILNEVGEFILLRENLGIADSAKTYSPGNLAAVTEDAPYRTVLDYWISGKRTLRYSGCMVADVHHILSKGQGVFTYPAGTKNPNGKLRLAFECGPFAYIVEAAGGAASDGSKRILDIPIREIDQRAPIIVGSKDEVAAVCKLLTA
jgi:fructose-1,6-bisphosphatase I